MSKTCQFTGKKPCKGKTYSKRGIAKKNKGIGLNITGSCKRRFTPNIIKKRFWYEEESRYITLKLSAAAIRTMTKIGMKAVVDDVRSKGYKV